MTAARLNMLGVPTLIIDKQERSGDAWRTRYHHLVLHDPCWMNAMPYMPYPPNWPVSKHSITDRELGLTKCPQILASKDKMADFFEVGK